MLAVLSLVAAGYLVWGGWCLLDVGWFVGCAWVVALDCVGGGDVWCVVVLGCVFLFVLFDGVWRFETRPG
ncbi:hypothetical protein RA272_29505, partial [Pseudomonas syringae pv. tagetis]|uniref:hypothetical protein n=1 Tax=Pseudomonas syringae group genomosp. 7 TaxID=251699 RepID=UPI0037703AB6